MKREQGKVESQEKATQPLAEQGSPEYIQVMTGVWADKEGNVVIMRDPLMGQTLEIQEGKIISRVSDK